MDLVAVTEFFRRSRDSVEGSLVIGGSCPLDIRISARRRGLAGDAFGVDGEVV